jgi:hypothetical protein
MKTLAASLSLLVVATLAGCGAPYYAPAQNERGAPIVPQAADFRPGTGVVVDRTVAPAPMGGASGGTATGASAHPAGTSATDRPEPPVGQPSSSAGRLVRLAIRMDDGMIQYVDTDSNEFQPGMRVELTPDRMIRRAP